MGLASITALSAACAPFHTHVAAAATFCAAAWAVVCTVAKMDWTPSSFRPAAPAITGTRKLAAELARSPRPVAVSSTLSARLPWARACCSCAIDSWFCASAACLLFSPNCFTAAS
jgi:hypothetical protein